MSKFSRWERMLKREKGIPINQLYDASTLRDFISSQKRHTIRRPIRPVNQLPHRGGMLGSMDIFGDRIRT